jgi:cellulose synthase/poly-beta-1,6-N-acetylglucosamine synthase-like glycosyltransferase/GGDEF domain-containing protein
LIVSDIMMPEMDGLEFLEALRADPALRLLPVIMLTTKSTLDDVVRGFDLGADDYLAKPVDPRELAVRVRSKIERPPVPADTLREDRQTGLLSAAALRSEMAAELARSARGGYPCTLARVRIYELHWLTERLGPRAGAALSLAVGRMLTAVAEPLELVGRAEDGSFLFFSPGLDATEMGRRLEVLGRSIVRSTFQAGGESVRLTPLSGYAGAQPGISAAELEERAGHALEHAAQHLDLRPQAFEPSMAARLPAPTGWRGRLAARLEPWRLTFQIVATFAIGWLLPFGLYAGAGALGLNLAGAVYVLVVAALLVTAVLIWIEGLLSLRRRDPPDLPDEAFGPMSAVIAAYLPNEAATLESTIEAFLRVDYPAPTQIVLAYNTPVGMPIEERFAEIARDDPRFLPLRVQDSTSKAQNVNAALSVVRNPVCAVYDADHQPDADAFRRAWRWIASGSDVVQGHCFIRNGDASWVARMVAIEFETIYAVSHPGRARLHGFGLFGGSNGFWRTDLLREIRFRGSMLTEDIDSALRAVEEGRRITSDPWLVSRELSPTTLKGLTNQRLRWAQGWYQVAKTRIASSLRSPNLSLRQKLGMAHLLVWRETFPWLSMQIVPIIAYWVWRAGSFAAVDWFVPLLLWITLFIMVTGPGQLVFTWANADPEMRRNPRWFWQYLVLSIVFYAGYKNILARVANIKELLGEKAWKVTPRA